MVKAVMVYIKVVLKPPSASHNSEAIQEAQEEENIYIKKIKGIGISKTEAITYRTVRSQRPTKSQIFPFSFSTP